MKSPRHEPIFMAPNDHPRVRLEVSGGPNDPPWTHLWPMKVHMTRILCIFWRSWARNGRLMESSLSCDTHNALMTLSATAVFPWSIWRVSSADGRLWWRSPPRMKYTQIIPIPDPLFNSLTSAQFQRIGCVEEEFRWFETGPLCISLLQKIQIAEPCSLSPL